MTDETTLAATPGDEQIVNLDQAETPPAETGAEAEAKTEEETEKPEGAGDGAGEEGQSDDDKPKKLSGSRRERLRNEQLRRENEELRSRNDALERRSQAGEVEDKEPQEADFPDYIAYLEAKNAHNTRKIIREERQRDQQSRSQSDQQAHWQEAVLDHNERVEKARSEISDFDKVLASSGPVSDEVGKAIILSDNSALLAYRIGRDSALRESLNGMTGLELARAIGRLEGSVRMPPKNTKTNAPAPLSPLKGGASPAFDPKSASMDDYIAKRKAGWNG